MAEYVIDLTGVEVKTGVTGSDRIAALWGVPLHEEIVRCRNCESATDHCEGMDIYWCEYLSRYVGADMFCAWGRRADA